MGVCLSKNEGSSSVIWFDTNIKSPENVEAAKSLQNNLSLEVVGDDSGSFKRLDHLSHEHSTIVIVSGRLKQDLIAYVQSKRLQPWVRVIVYCGNKANHKDAYSHKFVAEVVDQYSLLEQTLKKLIDKPPQLAQPLVAKVATNDQPKDIRIINVELLSHQRQTYLNHLELQMPTGTFIVYRPINARVQPPPESVPLGLEYSPLQDLARFKMEVCKQVVALFAEEGANCLLAAKDKNKVDAAPTYWRFCRELLTMLSSSRNVLELLGRKLFPAYQLLPGQYAQLYLAIFSNFIFHQDTRKQSPVKRLVTKRNWGFIPHHSIIQHNNLVVYQPFTGKEEGDLEIKVVMGEHIVSNNLFAPYVVLDDGRLVYAPYSRFVVRSIEEQGKTTMILGEVWSQSLAERVCYPNLILTNPLQLVLETVMEANITRNQQLSKLWMFRYYLNRYVAEGRTDEDLSKHILNFLMENKDHISAEMACLRFCYEEATKVQLPCVEPNVNSNDPCSLPQFFFQAAEREYHRNNFKAANELAFRYLKLAENQQHRCNYEANIVANFMVFMTGNKSLQQAQDILHHTQTLIGANNYIAATLCQIIGRDHLKHKLTRPAEMYLRRGVSLWEAAGVTHHKSLMKCFEGLAELYRERDMQVEVRLFIRKARTSQP